MMKLILFGAVAFVLGLGGTTGVLVVTAPVPPAGADSTAAHAPGAKPAGGPAGAHAEPASHAAAATPPVTGGGTHAEPAAGPAAGAGHAADGAPAPADAQPAIARPVETVVRPQPAPGANEGRPATAPDAESYKQVGNILMNMKPAEAAKILAYLSDTHVEGLLRGMTPRNAANVLSQLPSERAAALSRRLLVPESRAERP